MTRTMRHTLTMRGAGVVAAVVASLAVAIPAQASHRFVPHRVEQINAPGPVGSQDNPMYVHSAPNENDGGGSWAYADSGLYQVLRANKPSGPAAAICGIIQPGDALWISGGMMLPGKWVAVQVTTFTRQSSDVGIIVNDPDGTHGGDCAPIGLVLRRVQ